MRDMLAPLVNTRHRFRATVARTGADRHGQLTLLLCDVTGNEGWHVSDHVWIDLTDEIIRAGYRIGERLSFSAEVQSYRKLGGEVDYQLVRLRDVRSQTARNRRKRGQPARPVDESWRAAG